MKKNALGGTHYDFVALAAPDGGNGLTPAEIIIIENNTGSQVNYKQNYSDTTLDDDGYPTLVEIYEDDTMARKLWTTTTVFVDGQPTTMTKINEDDNTTQTIDFTFTPTKIQVRKS